MAAPGLIDDEAVEIELIGSRGDLPGVLTNHADVKTSTLTWNNSRRIGIAEPGTKFRIFVSTTTAHDIAMTGADLESQIALFFRLGPASGIVYEFRGP